MEITPSTTDVTALYEAFTAPWTGDPFDTAACAARGAQARQVAAAILAARVSTQVGHMTIVAAGWSLESSRQAAGDPGSPEWYASLGSHEDATLTADGGYVARDLWCRCGDTASPAGNWVRYEAFTADGMAAHGFACPHCRCLTQTG